jgi:hypothetical protein
MKVRKLESFYIVNKIKEHLQYKEELLKLIDKLPKKKTELVSNSDWEISKEINRDYVGLFLKIIIPYIKEINSFMKTKKWMLHNIWFHQYNKNSGYGWHVHEATNFTNVYYLEMPDPDMKTQSFDLLTNKIFDIDVKEGDLLTMPGHIVHRAPIIKTDSRKTVIAFNCSFVDSNLWI